MAQKQTNKPLTDTGDAAQTAATTPAAATKPAETQYSAADLAAAARTRFNVPPDVVRVALKLAGKDKATLTEAEGLVKAFMGRKVKK